MQISNLDNEARIAKVKEGIDFILSHFEGRQPLFPRKISTGFSNGKQFAVYSREQILEACIKSNFIDCRINAYPVLSESHLQAPNIIFIDLDMPKGLPYQEALKQLERTKDKNIKTIKEKLDGYRSTILWTGNGYHIYIVLETRPLEIIKELKELSPKPSEEFLKFGEQLFSNNKSDPKHNASFQSLLLKIPFTYNSKSIRKEKDAEVKIIQRFDLSKIPQINIPLLREFRLYLADEDLKNKRDNIRRQNMMNSQQSMIDTRGQSYQWIDTLLKTPLIDNRKFCLWKIFIPYLVNVRKLSEDEVVAILMKWFDDCNDLRKLDFEPSKKIKENIRYVKRYLPISKTKLKEENMEIYNYLID